MSRTLLLQNRQKLRRVNLRLLRTIADRALEWSSTSGSVDLGIYLVAEPEITRLNETFLKHAGSTDVISFNYSERESELIGEIFICVCEAIRQSKMFRTSWQSELVRYVVHGILHLKGFDDLRAAERRKMKDEENRLMRKLISEFDLAKLALSAPARRTKMRA